MRIMGIDWGEKRIGIALSDPLYIFAQSFSVIEFKSKRELLEKIRDIIQEKEISKIVVGLPRRTDGKEGWAEKQVEKFVNWLRKSLSLEVITWDERYTSKLAKQITMDAKKIDALSAQIMLQSYLESLR